MPPLALAQRISIKIESNQEIWKLFKKKKIPVEICLTSNVLCQTAASYEDHHVTRLQREKHPFAISVSDDLLIISLSLTPTFTFNFVFLHNRPMTMACSKRV